MKKRILLLGYSGKGNFGDDLLQKQCYDALAADGSFQMVIHSPEDSSASDYLRYWFPEAEIIRGPISFRLLTAQKLVLYFGGGIFFDYGRHIGLSLFLRRMLSQLRLFFLPRLFFGVRFFGVGIGLGPFFTDRSFQLVASRLRQFSYLGLRDRESLEMLQQAGLSRIHLAPDLSLLETLHQPVREVKRREGSGRKILVCPRHYPHGEKGNQYLNSLLSALEKLKQSYPGSEFTVFGFQKNHDEGVLEVFEKKGFQTSIWDPAQMRPDAVTSLFAAQDLVISSRMHGIFMAGITSVPSLGIGVHPKLHYAASFFEESRSVSEDAGADALFAEAVAALSDEKRTAPEKLRELGRQCRREYELLIAELKKHSA